MALSIAARNDGICAFGMAGSVEKSSRQCGIEARYLAFLRPRRCSFVSRGNVLGGRNNLGGESTCVNCVGHDARDTHCVGRTQLLHHGAKRIVVREYAHEVRTISLTGWRRNRRYLKRITGPQAAIEIGNPKNLHPVPTARPSSSASRTSSNCGWDSVSWSTTDRARPGRSRKCLARR